MIGTDPCNPDTDGDGLNDFIETEDVDNPRDSDGDGLIDPLDEDDDGDGILTLNENTEDADGDGSPDGDTCLLYTSPSPRDATLSRMPSSA